MGDESPRPDATVRETAGTRDDGTAQRGMLVPDEVLATFGLPATQRGAALRALAEPSAPGAALGRGQTAVARFEMHALPPGPTTGIIRIELTVDLTTHAPYRVLGGTLAGDIYTGPLPDERWEVIGGTVGVHAPSGPPPQEPTPAQLVNNSLYLDAARVTEVPPIAGAAEAKLVDNGPRVFAMLAFLWPPATYQGAWTYGQGLFAWFPHVTLFMGWQPTPPQ